jgi:hypothetical protein
VLWLQAADLLAIDRHVQDVSKALTAKLIAAERIRPWYMSESYFTQVYHHSTLDVAALLIFVETHITDNGAATSCAMPDNYVSCTHLKRHLVKRFDDCS